MNKKRLIVSIVVLILLLGLWYILHQRRPAQQLKALFSLKAEQIDKIEIWDAEDRVVLKKEGSKWKTLEPLVWNADTTQVNKLFSQVIEAKYPAKSISLSREAVKHYKLLEDEALHIRISSGGRTEQALFSNLGNSWDYFRYAAQNDVYQINSKVVQFFPPLAYLWRSSQIIHYWEEDIASIRCKFEQDDYTLFNDNGDWRLKNKLYDFGIDPGNYVLSKLINILQNMNTYILTDGRESIYKEAFEKPLCEVWITATGGTVQKLSFARLDNERHMLLVDDDYHVIFEVGFDTAFRFMRNAELYKRISL